MDKTSFSMDSSFQDKLNFNKIEGFCEFIKGEMNFDFNDLNINFKEDLKITSENNSILLQKFQNYEKNFDIFIKIIQKRFKCITVSIQKKNKNEELFDFKVVFRNLNNEYIYIKHNSKQTQISLDENLNSIEIRNEIKKYLNIIKI